MERDEGRRHGTEHGSRDRRSRYGEIAAGWVKSWAWKLPAEITGKYRAGDIRHCFADITRRVWVPNVPSRGYREVGRRENPEEQRMRQVVGRFGLRRNSMGKSQHPDAKAGRKGASHGLGASPA